LANIEKKMFLREEKKLWLRKKQVGPMKESKRTLRIRLFPFLARARWTTLEDLLATIMAKARRIRSTVRE
jgi:hypothetical protein